MGGLLLRATVAPAASCPEIDAGGARVAVLAAATWIEIGQRPDGAYLYEFNRESGAEPDDYNVVRHAGVTMSLYQLAAAGDLSALPAADRGLAYMQKHLLRRDNWAAFRDPRSGSIQLGASALMLAGLDQRRLATNDRTHDELMREVARFIVLMQREDGAFLASWLPFTGAPDPSETSKYATGEAFWALAMMHEAFPAEGWDHPTRLVADYLSTRRDKQEGFDFPPWADQWAAYGLAEMADWPLSNDNIAYARSLAERFGFLVRIESGRRNTPWSDFIHGRQARAAGMGTWVEALASLWRLSGEEPRLSDIQEKIAERARCGAGMLRARQFAKSPTTGTREAGAWFTNGVTRMDDQQHALSALLRSEAILQTSAK
jgi:hypothetical protein